MRISSFCEEIALPPATPIAPISARATARRARGFSLVELLAVLAVMGICALIAMPLLRENGSALSPQTVSLAAFFDAARSLAVARSTRARVVFHNDPADAEHYRRWVGIVVQAGIDPSGTPLWQTEGPAVLLRSGSFYFPTKPATGTAPFAMPVWVLGREALCQAYEYEPSGAAVQGGCHVVLVHGFVEGRRLIVPRPELRDGFLLRPYGGVTRADRPEQLPAPSE